MRQHTRTILWSLLVVAALSGCADPAADKPAAIVNEPVPAPQVDVQPPTGTRFVIDPESSKIQFVGSKVTGQHDGGFTTFEGEIHVVPESAEASRVNVVIDTRSIWADNPKLTDHLKSPDFFEVETYPTATFTSTTITGTGPEYVVTGNLTLHGVTKSISFPAHIEMKPDGLTANAEFSIKRYDFGIEYKGKADDLIRDDVVVKFDLKAQPSAASTKASEDADSEAASLRPEGSSLSAT